MSLSPQSDDDGSAAALMAETMGFSSFGAQSRPSKKRRMNSDVAVVHITPSAPTAATAATADHVVASGALTVPAAQSGDATHHREKGKPTNLPLHCGGAAAGRSQNLKPQNEDEIDLDADEDEQGGGEAEGGAPLGTTTSAVSSRPQSQTGASTLTPRPPPPAPTNLDGNCCSESTSQHGFDIRLAARPYQHQHKLFAGPNSSSGSLPSGFRDNTNHHKWWLDYYDPTFNRNPWEALERKLGLEPRGPWPPRAA